MSAAHAALFLFDEARLGAIPGELKRLKNWVVWKYVLKWPQRSGKRIPTKVPINPRTGECAKTNNPNTWSNFQTAVDSVHRLGGDGVGLVLTKTAGFFGIDLDHCRNYVTGEIVAWAMNVIRQFDSYTEVSPYGTGVRIICRGSLPQGRRKNGDLEWYDDLRFLTITGAALDDAPIRDGQEHIPWFSEKLDAGKKQVLTLPRPIQRAASVSGGVSDEEVLRNLRSAKNGDKFKQLCRGESGHSSMSELDLAICGIIAFWTQDREQIKRLWLCSVPHRDKYDRRDYVDRTVDTALKDKIEFHNPTRCSRVPASRTTLEVVNSLSTINSSSSDCGHVKLDLAPETFNDTGNAKRLIALHGHDMRYCHQRRSWFVWDGMRWKIDETGQARRRAQLTMSDFHKQAVVDGNEAAVKFAIKSLDERRISNLLSMAESEIYVLPDQLDAQPLLLSFKNGTFDISTGELREHRRADLLTKLVHHAYNPHALAPLWLKTLHRLMGGGPDASESELEIAERMVSFLQLAAGYSITGDVREKVLFMLYGPKGNNGKSTFLSVLAKLIEEHAVQIDIGSLMAAAHHESANSASDLSRLRGARFAKTSETEEGQRLAEGKLKRLIQGMEDGKISSTRKYENSTEFKESHKLWMDCNHRPVIRGTENALWNRIRLIPFNVVLDAAEIDFQLPKKLVTNEAEGILAWLVEGACKWLKNGLGHPSELAAAQSEYRDEMDPLKDFIEERCVVGDHFSARSTALYSDYSRWATETHQPKIYPVKAIKSLIEGKLFIYKHDEKGSVVKGLGLRALTADVS